MSKVFYDKYISFPKLERAIKRIAKDMDEKHEIWHLVDELIHHRVLICILDNLPEKHHEEFVVKLHNKPHSGSLLKYLKKKIEKDVEEFLKKEIESVEREVLDEIRQKSK